MPSSSFRKPNVNCYCCNKSIYRRPKQIKSGKVFCSQRCCGIFNRKVKFCSCGIKITNNKTYCSRKCSNVNRTGIKYRVGQPRNKSEKIKRLKDQLVQLRGSKCQRCPYNKIEILVIHHIIQKCDGGF